MPHDHNERDVAIAIAMEVFGVVPHHSDGERCIDYTASPGLGGKGYCSRLDGYYCIGCPDLINKKHPEITR